MGHSWPLFLYFRLFNTNDSKQMFKKSLLMTGFEPRITGVGGDRFTNWATTTVPIWWCLWQIIHWCNKLDYFGTEIGSKVPPYLSRTSSNTSNWTAQLQFSRMKQSCFDLRTPSGYPGGFLGVYSSGFAFITIKNAFLLNLYIFGVILTKNSKIFSLLEYC